MSAWIEGFCRCPTFEVVCRGSRPTIAMCVGIERNASMTTLPLTDWSGSTTTATARSLSCSNDFCVLTSTPESQQPKPGCEWYQPTTISERPVWVNMSSMSVWKTWSTASTETPVPDCGMAKTSTTRIV
eukprot:Amastigsp_a508550_293.p4 type:complete len:129 gc:universal Amastigsp_a508550_293:631-245(-)